MFCALTSAFCFTGAASRIPQGVVVGAPVEVGGTLHPYVARSLDQGELDPSTALGTMVLNIRLSPGQQAQVEALLSALQDPRSMQYHQWLTQEEYGERFGLSESDLAALTAWLAGNGLQVRSVSASRNAIYFSGTAGQVEQAFHTQLHRLLLDGETHIANVTEISVPSSIAKLVLNIRGLSDFRPRPQLHRQMQPDYTLNSSTHFLTPGDWAVIYNVNDIYTAGYTGSGAYVGVVGQTYAPQSDIDHFRSAAGLPATKLTYVCIDSSVSCTGSSAISTGADLGEADLDIEWAGGIAKNATVSFVYAPYSDVTNSRMDVFDALQYAVQTYKASGAVLPVVSMSYSGCESGMPASEVTWVTQVGQQANTQAQTLLVASGDSGAAGCDPHGDPNDTSARYGAYAGVPADSPNFTGVGGTEFNEGGGNYLYWNSAAGVVVSAQSYIPESAWNESSSSGLLAGGGGVSQKFAMPSWQSPPADFTGTPMRFVPDVSFSAAMHDGYMTCSQQENGGALYNALGHIATATTATTTTAITSGNAMYETWLTATIDPYQASGNVVFKVNGTVAGVVPLNDGSTQLIPIFADPALGFVIGNNTITANYLGDEKYQPSGGTTSVSLSQASTTTTITVSVPDTTLGSTITLTATSNLSEATGTVTFYVGATPLGTATMNGGMAALNVVASQANGFVVGSGNSLTAAFSGSSTMLPSTSSAVRIGVYLADTMTVTITPSSQLPYEPFTVTATVTPTPGAGILFYSYPGAFSEGWLWNGTISLTIQADPSEFAIGPNTFNFSFGGDSSYAACSGSAIFTLLPFNTDTGLSPASATTGSSALTLTVNGSGFDSNSIVLWNNQARVTTYVSSTRLTAAIPASDLIHSGTALVTVATGAPAMQIGAAQPFIIASGPTLPTISSATVYYGYVSNGQPPLLVTGTGFTSASIVRLNGTALATSYLSPFQLEASNPASTSYVGEPIVVVNATGASQPFAAP